MIHSLKSYGIILILINLVNSLAKTNRIKYKRELSEDLEKED